MCPKTHFICTTWWFLFMTIFHIYFICGRDENHRRQSDPQPHPQKPNPWVIVTIRVQFIRLTCYTHFRFASHCVSGHINVSAPHIFPSENGSLDFECSTQCHKIFYCKTENVSQIGILKSFNCPVFWPQCKKTSYKNVTTTRRERHEWDLGVCFYMHQ